MWTDGQLDKANYVAFYDWESRRELYVGTIEIQESAYQGPYLVTPVPPFGSLKNGDGLIQGGLHVRVPQKLYTTQASPLSWPPPVNNDTPIHQYGDGTA